LLAIDGESWHLLALDSSEDGTRSVRYRAHDSQARFTELSVRHSAIANCATGAASSGLRWEAELQRARSGNLSYVEVGGWAIAPERRLHRRGLGPPPWPRTALARILGPAVWGLRRPRADHSSSILRRLAAAPYRLAGDRDPAYYDPQYRCDMEVLRFDSAIPRSTILRAGGRTGTEVF